MTTRIGRKHVIRIAALAGALLTLAGCVVAPYPPPRYAYYYHPYRPHYYHPYYGYYY